MLLISICIVHELTVFTPSCSYQAFLTLFSLGYPEIAAHVDTPDFKGFFLLFFVKDCAAADDAW